MEDIHEWLYDHYAQPKLGEQPLFQDQIFAPLLETLPETLRLPCLDMLHTLRLHWCTAAFTLGLQTGLRLESGPAYFSSNTET